MTDLTLGTPRGAAILHNFFRSSTSHRVRIALNLKRLPYQYVSYQLRSGDHRKPGYLDLNPQGLVPTLQLSDGTLLTQSLAIIEYLDEIIPSPALLPADPAGRARVRSLAQIIAIDIHPINNLRVLNHLRSQFNADDEKIAEWFRHWVHDAFGAFEKRLLTEPQTGTFCHGEIPSLADICLAAQVTSNARFSVTHERYPTVCRIAAACEALPAFREASPALQPDHQ